MAVVVIVSASFHFYRCLYRRKICIVCRLKFDGFFLVSFIHRFTRFTPYTAQTNNIQQIV